MVAMKCKYGRTNYTPGCRGSLYDPTKIDLSPDSACTMNGLQSEKVTKLPTAKLLLKDTFLKAFNCVRGVADEMDTI